MVKDLPIRNQKPVKVGNSWYFTIPWQYIKHGAISLKTRYILDIGKSIKIKNLQPAKSGDSYYFSIAIELIREKAIKLDKAYDIVVNECVKRERS